jgi:predicted ribosomally synthesized peptide with nif11-like leader
MSAENAGKLIDTLKGNESLKAKFKAAGAGGFEALAKAQGHPCTVAEFQTALKHAAKQVKLTDADLDKVAGGLVVVVSIAVV